MLGFRCSTYKLHEAAQNCTQWPKLDLVWKRFLPLRELAVMSSSCGVVLLFSRLGKQCFVEAL